MPPAPPPASRSSALDGMPALAVPFVLAFALRSDLARVPVPAPVQYLADGGYVLMPLFLVLAGFLLCRPLAAVLASTGTATTSSRAVARARAVALVIGMARRIGPLHLVAWVITFGWLVSAQVRPSTWSSVAGALLLNGVAGPERAGYPVSWSVSVGVLATLLLVAVSLGLATRRSRPGRGGDQPERVLTSLAVGAGLIGTGLLLWAGPDATGTLGPPAAGQALLGLGSGVICFRVLEGATGTFTPPIPRTAPTRLPTPGLGAVLALGAMLFCIYRSDLMHQLDLLPVFPAAAAVVYFLALPEPGGPSPLHRLLLSRWPQWLGSRALAIYLLHGPVQLTVERLAELAGLDRTSAPVTGGIIAVVVVGSLGAADLGHRLLDVPARRAPADPVTLPAGVLTVNRIPRSRSERIAQAEIPRELRLLPLPRKQGTGTPAKPAVARTAPAKSAPAGPAAAGPAAAGPAVAGPAVAGAATVGAATVGAAAGAAAPGKAAATAVPVTTAAARATPAPVKAAATRAAATAAPVKAAAARAAAARTVPAKEIPAKAVPAGTAEKAPARAVPTGTAIAVEKAPAKAVPTGTAIAAEKAPAEAVPAGTAKKAPAKAVAAKRPARKKTVDTVPALAIAEAMVKAVEKKPRKRAAKAIKLPADAPSDQPIDLDKPIIRKGTTLDLDAQN